MVRRLLGIARLPDVATVSRTLAGMDSRSVTNCADSTGNRFCNALMILAWHGLPWISDGSVLATGRFAEGTAVGFNPQEEGQRSYYPLFCTLAQTGQSIRCLASSR